MPGSFFGIGPINWADAVRSGMLVQRVSEGSDGYSYVGYSTNDNPSEAAAEWLILRRDTDGNSAFADGTRQFDKVWNDRADYTYAV